MNTPTSYTHPMATRNKYRPVLTALQITHILALAKTESPISDLSISLISTLSPFAAKIANAGITPAYETIDPLTKPTVLASLGGEEPITPINPSITKETHWQNCYNKYKDSPTECSVEEIQGAREWRYLNDLMDSDEIAQFEDQATHEALGYKEEREE